MSFSNRTRDEYHVCEHCGNASHGEYGFFFVYNYLLRYFLERLKNDVTRDERFEEERRECDTVFILKKSGRAAFEWRLFRVADGATVGSNPAWRV